MQCLGGLPQNANFLLTCKRHAKANFIQLLLSPKEVAKKSARFSKRGKESSTFIDSSHFTARLA